MTLYIHVRNWDDWQNPDVTRGKSTRAPWIKDHLAQLNDEKWLELGFAERGLLQSLRLQYAANRGRGVADSTANLARTLGQRVYRSQLERLNHAGFIEILPGKVREDSRVDVDVDVDGKRPLTADAVEDDSSSSEQAESVAAAGDKEQNEGRKDEPQVGRGRSSLEELFAADAEERALTEPEVLDEPRASDVARSEPDGNAGLGSGSASASEGPARPPRPRDLLWDELERVLGSVAEKTSAHGLRNRVVADLRKNGATLETLRYALDAYPRRMPAGTLLTDIALAKHYPMLVVDFKRRERARVAACEACGMGGGLHVADCPRWLEGRAA